MHHGSVLFRRAVLDRGGVDFFGGGGHVGRIGTAWHVEGQDLPFYRVRPGSLLQNIICVRN